MMTHRNRPYEAVAYLVEYLLASGELEEPLLALVDQYELVSLVMAEELEVEQVDQTELVRQSEALYRDLWDRY